MKRHDVDKMKKNNPNLFKETWSEKQKRLAREEEDRLENAVVRRSQFIQWKKGEVIN